MMEIDNKKARELLDNLALNDPNLIFYIWSLKKDGTLRKMRCKLDISKYSTGAGPLYDPKDYDLLWVCDMDLAKEYEGAGKKPIRSIRLSAIQRMVINGVEYKICR